MLIYCTITLYDAARDDTSEKSLYPCYRVKWPSTVLLIPSALETAGNRHMWMNCGSEDGERKE